MKQRKFEDRYSDEWQQFEHTLLQLEKKLTKKQTFPNSNATQPLALAGFAQSYRQICHCLSLAKQRQYSSYLIDRLNDLAIRGHQQIYKRRLRLPSKLTQFLVVDFPALVRQEASYFWLACGLFFLPGMMMAMLTIFYPELIYSVFTPEQVTMFEAMYDPGVENIGRERQSDDDFAMFGFYIRNNIGVSFRTFAGGILFGLGSVFFLVYNGVVLGSVAGHLTEAKYLSTFYPFVIGHGAFELTAICLAGAAGLMLGFSLVAPGRHPRVYALKKAAAKGIQIIYGVVVMLLIAAFLEAYWSSITTIPNTIKYFIGACLWLLVTLYFTLSGRSYET